MSYQIGDVSKITRTSIKTLRYYHEIDLVCPSYIDESSGYRYYNNDCIEKLRRIKLLKELNFSLKEIKDILDNYNEDEYLFSIITEKIEQTKIKIKEYKSIQKKLESMISGQKSIDANNSDVITIKKVPDMLISSIKTSDEYGNIGIYFDKIIKEYASFICGKPFTLYYDTEYSEGDIEMEICIPVKKTIRNSLVKTRILKGGQVLSAHHVGAYDNIGNAYQLLIDYINKNDLKTTTPTREIYIKGPGVIFIGNPNKYITEVQIMTI